MVVGGLVLPCAVYAQDAAVDAKAAAALSDQHFCSGCHQMDAKVVGPGLKQIAAKYKSDKEAPARLAERISKGSTGVWGDIPMPANPQVSEADIKKLVAWILSL